MSLNLSDIFKKKYLKGYFKRNKKIFITAIVLFVLLGVLSVFAGGYSQTVSLSEKSLSQANIGDDSTHPDLKNITTVESFVELTCHNLIQDLTCLFGGLLLFIPSLFISAINAYNFLTIFITYPLPVIIYGILPHGIFEIPSSIFALAGAIMLFKTEINVIKGIISSKTTVKDKINESEYLIKDAIITCFIVILLLVVAGFIEIFITPGLIDNFALDYI